ncbi:MAG TPA: GNAT family N-acetyltransferase [Solirubrobacteraceae bacterium]|jgi:CelD/BcsL family acetyltransferase involved in cellulose biosynthesis
MDWPYSGEIDSILVAGIWDLHKAEVQTIYEIEPGKRYGISLLLDIDLDLEILVSAPSSWDVDAHTSDVTGGPTGGGYIISSETRRCGCPSTWCGLSRKSSGTAMQSRSVRASSSSTTTRTSRARTHPLTIAPMAELSVREFRNLDGIPAAAWESLTARPPASLSGSYAWVAAAFETVHPAGRPILFTAEARGRLAGLLPLALYEHRDGATVRFAAAPRNDLSDLLVLPGDAANAGAAIVAALARAARSRGWAVELDAVDPGGVLASIDSNEDLSWGPGDPSPFVDLKGDWQSAASPRRLRRWRRARQQLCARHHVEVRRVVGSDVDRHQDEFARLRDARLTAKGRQVGLPQPAFLRRVIRELGARGRAEFMQLVIDGETVACDLYLVERPFAMIWLRGLHPSWARFPCGHLLLRASAEALADDGFTTLDLGRGDEPYKYLFGAERRVLRQARLRPS